MGGVSQWRSAGRRSARYMQQGRENVTHVVGAPVVQESMLFHPMYVQIHFPASQCCSHVRPARMIAATSTVGTHVAYMPRNTCGVAPMATVPRTIAACLCSLRICNTISILPDTRLRPMCRKCQHFSGSTASPSQSSKAASTFPKGSGQWSPQIHSAPEALQPGP